CTREATHVPASRYTLASSPDRARSSHRPRGAAPTGSATKPRSVNIRANAGLGSSACLPTTASHLTGEVGSASPRPTGPVRTISSSTPGECSASVITRENQPASTEGSSPCCSALPSSSRESASTPRTVAGFAHNGALSASSSREGCSTVGSLTIAVVVYRLLKIHHSKYTQVQQKEPPAPRKTGSRWFSKCRCVRYSQS